MTTLCPAQQPAAQLPARLLAFPVCSTPPFLIHLVMDVSASMRSHLRTAVCSVEQFLWILCKRQEPRDRVRLTCFSGYTRGCLQIVSHPVYEPIHQPSSVKRLRRFSRSWRTGSTTALFDAIFMGAEDLRAASVNYEECINMLIVITDGRDNDSRLRPCNLFLSGMDFVLVGKGPEARQTVEELSHLTTSCKYIDTFYDLSRALPDATDEALSHHGYLLSG